MKQVFVWIVICLAWVPRAYGQTPEEDQALLDRVIQGEPVTAESEARLLQAFASAVKGGDCARLEKTAPELATKVEPSNPTYAAIFLAQAGQCVYDKLDRDRGVVLFVRAEKLLRAVDNKSSDYWRLGATLTAPALVAYYSWKKQAQAVVDTCELLCPGLAAHVGVFPKAVAHTYSLLQEAYGTLGRFEDKERASEVQLTWAKKLSPLQERANYSFDAINGGIHANRALNRPAGEARWKAIGDALMAQLNGQSAPAGQASATSPDSPGVTIAIGIVAGVVVATVAGLVIAHFAIGVPAQLNAPIAIPAPGLGLRF